MRRKAGWLAGALVLAGAGEGAAARDVVASFDWLAYEAEAANAPEGRYANPVIPGFHPDPSIVRVGRDFYAVTSTFSWYPGLPILHSTDLVNWRIIGNAIDRPGMLDFSGIGTNRGLFAPAITHHDGRFWIVNTCIECGGNFVITADDPAGPWSDPVWLDFGGIDPVAMTMLPKRTLLRDKGVDPATKPVWAEGPHIYKVGEWYYLIAAEGGTEARHSQTIYRSRALQGPYEPGPNNPILTQRDLPAGRPDRIEATGHADIVQLEDGSWWGVFLATRPFAGQSTLMGRETFLLPVTWKDGWPRFLEKGAPVPLTRPAPKLPASSGAAWDNWREEFVAPLSNEWLALRTPGAAPQWEVRDGALEVIAGPAAPGGMARPAFTGRRLRHHKASFSTRLVFTPERRGDFAGLLAFMDETHFLAAGKEQGRIVVRLRTSAGDWAGGKEVASAPLATDGPVELKLSLDGGTAAVFFREEGATGWRQVGGPLDVEPLASVHAGLFTGLVVGPYALSPGP